MSAVERILEPEEVWDYAMEHIDELIGVQTEIACHKDYGVEIYLTATNIYSLKVIVEADQVEVYEEKIINDVDCCKTIEKVYDNYLTSNALELLGGEIVVQKSQSEEEENEENIEERENELDSCVYEFVESVLGFNSTYDIGDFPEVLDDLKEHFLEYMARKHSIPIYRPMYLEDEEGEEFYEEYPYECIEFDDEDNPIYQ